MIADANGPTLQVTDTANYTVIVYDQQCSATAEDSVTINFYNEATANQIEDLITCDDSSNDGVEDFDLNIVTNDILGNQDSSEFVVTYFLSISDAQNNINSLSSPYNNTSNPQTIYARVEKKDAEKNARQLRIFLKILQIFHIFFTFFIISDFFN